MQTDRCGAESERRGDGEAKVYIIIVYRPIATRVTNSLVTMMMMLIAFI